MTGNNCERAQEYARRGLKVFPLHSIRNGQCSCGREECSSAGKHPRTQNGFLDATDDLEQICQLWQRHPDANIGIRTGRESGIYVVDIDPRHGGDTSIITLEAEIGLLPPSWTANSGSPGGCHRYLSSPVELSNREGFRPGLDLRGDGGYIVAPPSNHISGQNYSWVPGLSPWEIDLAPIPDALLTILTEETQFETSASEDEGYYIQDGHRNSELFKKGCSIHQRGFAPAAILEALKAENIARCKPPLDEIEIRRILQSVRRYKSDYMADPNWGRVQDLPPLIPNAPGMLAEMVPVPLRGFVTDLAERMNVPIEMAAVPLVVILSGLLGRAFGINPKKHDKDWLVIPNLYGGVVAPPGCLKSPMLQELTKPLKKFEHDAAEDFRKANDSFQMELGLKKAKLDALKAALKSASKGKCKSGSSEDIEKQIKDASAEVAALLREAPVQTRFYTNDGTTEKIGEICRDNPQGILVVRDELFGLLKSFEKSGRENDRTFYLEAWNGDGSYIVDRIGRGTIFVPHLCLAVLGSIQPMKLTEYFNTISVEGGSGDGLLTRFQLMVYPEMLRYRGVKDQRPDEDARETVIKIFRKFKELREGYDPEHGTVMFNFSPPAQEKFLDWLESLEREISERDSIPPLMKELLSKHRSLVPALSLIFHLCEFAAKEFTEEDISLGAVELAIEWATLLRRHAEKIFAIAIKSEDVAAHALALKIRTGKVSSGGTVREIYRKQWKSLRTVDQVNLGLTKLEELEWIRVVSVQQRVGAPSEIILINPHLAAKLAAEEPDRPIVSSDGSVFEEERFSGVYDDFA